MGDYMSVEHEVKQAKKFQWFLFAIIVPLIFAIILTFIISSVAGVDVWQKVQDVGSKIPFIASDSDDEQEETELGHYEAAIKDREADIDDLQTQLKKKDDQIQELEEQIQEYESQINELNDHQINQEESVKKLTNSFKEMEPEKAADIIVEMESNHAVQVLAQLPDDTRGSILSAMEAEDAASFTNELFNQ